MNNKFKSGKVLILPQRLQCCGTDKTVAPYSISGAKNNLPHLLHLNNVVPLTIITIIIVIHRHYLSHNLLHFLSHTLRLQHLHLLPMPQQHLIKVIARAKPMAEYTPAIPLFHFLL